MDRLPCSQGPAIDDVFLLAQSAEALGLSDSSLSDGAALDRRVWSIAGHLR
jgi:hypothetical protein